MSVLPLKKLVASQKLMLRNMRLRKGLTPSVKKRKGVGEQEQMKTVMMNTSMRRKMKMMILTARKKKNQTRRAITFLLLIIIAPPLLLLQASLHLLSMKTTS